MWLMKPNQTKPIIKVSSTKKSAKHQNFCSVNLYEYEDQPKKAYFNYCAILPETGVWLVGLSCWRMDQDSHIDQVLKPMTSFWLESHHGCHKVEIWKLFSIKGEKKLPRKRLILIKNFEILFPRKKYWYDSWLG